MDIIGLTAALPLRYERSERRRFVILWFVLLFSVVNVAPAAAIDEARKLVSLLDYLASDYKNAVQDGKVLSTDEYGEMREFSRRTLELFDELKASDKNDKAGIEADLKTLTAHIDHKASPESVAKLANSMKDKLIASYNIVTYPRRLPSLADGQKIYRDNCAQCHGDGGKGDGPGRQSMNPQTPLPADFTDPERMAGLSPFKAFNTASFGIEGTAMASFAALSEDQRWQVAFYIFSMRFTPEMANVGATMLKAKAVPSELTDVSTLASVSDLQLLERLKSYAVQESDAVNMLAYLRRGLLESKQADPIFIARTLLRESADLYVRGDNERAYQKAVEAYLDGLEMAEPSLFAKDSSFGRGLEANFTQFRNAIKQGESPEALQKRQQEIDAKLDQAAQILARDDSFSGYYSFLNSALIILREGLEAALILAAILAMLRVMGATDAIRYIHLGWIMAVLAGALTWIATETVLTLSGRHRESMEGFISVFAACALFYVGYWLHTRSEARKWQAYIQHRIKNVLSSKKILGLMGISFFAVYREAFEVVLFYQALWMQNENSHGAVIWGFVTGLIALIIATIAILKLGLRIPLKYFFGATGTLLYIMAFIFAGNGIKELQAAGWAPSTPLSFPPQVPVLGIYPTAETLLAQGVMVLAFIMTFFWMAKQKTA